jgi:hypothetical protein
MFMLVKRMMASVLVAGAAWGQQAAPDPAEAEKALRQRVQEFYQLQVDKKFRAAEAYIAEDTKDLFYASGKPDLASFSIAKIVMKDNDTRADVTVKGKVSMFVMGQGMVPIDLPTTGTWKIEDDKWVWYVDRLAAIQTPFGDVKPAANAPPAAATPDISAQVKNFDVASLQNMVRAEPSGVSLSEDQPVQSVTITNGMPGSVDLTLQTKSIPGIGIELGKTHLNAAEKVKLTLTRKGDTPASGNVRVEVVPLGVTLNIGVSSR